MDSNRDGKVTAEETGQALAVRDPLVKNVVNRLVVKHHIIFLKRLCIMLNINGSKAILKSVMLFFSIFLISPLYVFASTLENVLQRKGYFEWTYFFISEPFDGKNDKDSENEVIKLFDGKKIIFNGDLLTITNACSYKYAAQLNTPLSFFGGAKTVNYYNIIFSDYKIKIPGKFLDITPVNPSEKCEFPFSEFIVLDDVIVFFYENYAVFYFKTQEALKSHQKNNVGNDLLVNEKQMGMSKICKEMEHNTDNYNTSRECFYSGMSLIDAYREYRNELTDDDKNILRIKSFQMKILP